MAINAPKCRLCGKNHYRTCDDQAVADRLAGRSSPAERLAKVRGIVAPGRPVPEAPPAISKLADEVKALRAAIVERDSIIAGLRSELESMKARPSPSTPSEEPLPAMADEPTPAQSADDARKERNKRYYEAKRKAKLSAMPSS